MHYKFLLQWCHYFPLNVAINHGQWTGMVQGIPQSFASRVMHQIATEGIVSVYNLYSNVNSEDVWENPWTIENVIVVRRKLISQLCSAVTSPINELNNQRLLLSHGAAILQFSLDTVAFLAVVDVSLFLGHSLHCWLLLGFFVKKKEKGRKKVWRNALIEFCFWRVNSDENWSNLNSDESWSNLNYSKMRNGARCSRLFLYCG